MQPFERIPDKHHTKGPSDVDHLTQELAAFHSNTPFLDGNQLVVHLEY